TLKVVKEAAEMENFLGRISDLTSNWRKSSSWRIAAIERPRLSPSLGRSLDRLVKASAFWFWTPGRNTILKLYSPSWTAQRDWRRFKSLFCIKLWRLR